jgi:hypothetical protein
LAARRPSSSGPGKRKLLPEPGNGKRRNFLRKKKDKDELFEKRKERQGSGEKN